MADTTCLTVCVWVQDEVVGNLVLGQVAQGRLFGSSQPLHIMLCGSSSELPHLEGLKMDMEDCAYPLVTKVSIVSSLTQLSRAPDLALVLLSDQTDHCDFMRQAGLTTSITEVADSMRHAPSLTQTKIVVLGDQALSGAALLSHLLPGVTASNVLAINHQSQTNPKTRTSTKFPYILVSKFTSAISQWWTGKGENSEKLSSPVTLGTKFVLPKGHNPGYFFSVPVQIWGPQSFHLCSATSLDPAHVEQVKAETDTVFAFVGHTDQRSQLLPSHL